VAVSVYSKNTIQKPTLATTIDNGKEVKTEQSRWTQADGWTSASSAYIN